MLYKDAAVLGIKLRGRICTPLIGEYRCGNITLATDVITPGEYV